MRLRATAPRLISALWHGSCSGNALLTPSLGAPRPGPQSGWDVFPARGKRPCTLSPAREPSRHDLRRRRISLLRLSGVPWARIGESSGQRNLAVTANTYGHVLMIETELAYEEVSR